MGWKSEAGKHCGFHTAAKWLPTFLACPLVFSASAILAEDRGPAVPINDALPFDLPSTQELRSSPKKVFAHYFTPYPLSIDNKPPDEDYYSQHYLAVDGENGKHRPYGGYLRQRPVPQAPRPDEDWDTVNFEEEIRRAIGIGLDGFTVDMLSFEGVHWERTKGLLDAAFRVDPGFRILLMPDMEAGFKSHPEELAGAIEALAGHPSVFRRPDDRLVISPFNTQRQSAKWWKEWLIGMKALGVDISFVPLFQDWRRYADDFAAFSDGFSDWGWRSPRTQRSWRDVPRQAREWVSLWMAPVAPQDMRPRSQEYWEVGNSEGFRVMWENAIHGEADWVQLITWNDYSESTAVAPSTGTQWSFYDLSAYYITFFKTSRPPEIKRDVLYYFHRTHPASALPDPDQQPKIFRPAEGSDPPRDEIELLGFLTGPGILEIEINGTIHRRKAPAGVTSFQVPLTEGRPIFRLRRGGRNRITLKSAFSISSDISRQSLLVHGGSSTREPLAVHSHPNGSLEPGGGRE